MKIMIVLFILVVLVGCTRMAAVEERAAQVYIGMKRSEVEVLFPEKDGGLQSPASTRYYDHPGVMIEIPFDQTGGNWNKDNRVTGQPKIYRSRLHGD